MTPHKISLDVIQVSEPCTADWSAMEGDATRRFCSSCNKHVHNLSAMPKADAEALLASSQWRLCVRFTREDDGRIATGFKRTLHARLAAGLGVAALLGTMTGCGPSTSWDRFWQWWQTSFRGQSTAIMGDISFPPPQTTPTTAPAIMGEIEASIPAVVTPGADATTMGQALVDRAAQQCDPATESD